MRHLFLTIPVVLITLLTTACSTHSTITSLQNDATIEIKTNQTTTTPRSETFQTTSFGNYEFMAQASGKEPFFGILPLKFNGGYLALDILFFAPAAFFNLREPFAYYDFDLEKKVLKYKQTQSEDWTVYIPLTSEANRAKAYFGK